MSALEKDNPISPAFKQAYGIARLQGMDSKAMMAKILDETKTFCGNSPQSDDITLMSIRTG